MYRFFIVMCFFVSIFGVQGSQYIVNGSELSIVINEILPNPEGADNGNEWVELFNPFEVEINLEGYYLVDGSGKSFFIEGEVVAPGGFLVLYPSFSLNQSDEVVELFDPAGEKTDEFAYESSTEGLSWARIPDGVDGWQNSATPTPGASNTVEPEEFSCFETLRSVSIDEFKSFEVSTETSYILSGVVTAEEGQIYSDKIYIQDETAGIMVDLTEDIDEVSNGVQVKICASHTTYYDEHRASVLGSEAFEVLENVAVVEELPISIASAQNEGRLVSNFGVLASQTDSSFVLMGPTGDLMKVKTSHLEDVGTFMKESEIRVIGILTRCGSDGDGNPNYRIAPRSMSDIQVLSFSQEDGDSNFGDSISLQGEEKLKTAPSVKAEYVESNSKMSAVNAVADPSLFVVPKFVRAEKVEYEAAIERQPKIDEYPHREVGLVGFVISSSSVFLLFSKNRIAN